MIKAKDRKQVKTVAVIVAGRYVWRKIFQGLNFGLEDKKTLIKCDKERG